MEQRQAESLNLLKRLISVLVLIPPVLAAIYYGGVAFTALISVCFLILAWEWFGLCRAKIASWSGGLFIFSGAAMSLFAGYGQFQTSLLILFIAVAIFLGAHVFIDRTTSESSSEISVVDHRTHLWLAGGLFYIGLAVIALLWVRDGFSFGRDLIFWLFLVTWVSDTGAYAFGRLIGGPKLAPVLSPNKTWAGFIGAMVCAAGLGGGLAIYTDKASILAIILVSAILGMISQVGDLLESSVKRHFKAKDTGKLIPGHGGLLDRTDSLLAMSIAVGLILLLAREEVMQWM